MFLYIGASSSIGSSSALRKRQQQKLYYSIISLRYPWQYALWTEYAIKALTDQRKLLKKFFSFLFPVLSKMHTLHSTCNASSVLSNCDGVSHTKPAKVSGSITARHGTFITSLFLSLSVCSLMPGRWSTLDVSGHQTSCSRDLKLQSSVWIVCGIITFHVPCKSYDSVLI